jgi:DNA-binding MarR family transcriptional regulator
VGQDIFLLTLQAHGSLTQKELKEKLMIEFATINKIVTRSEKRGLVTKTKNPDDMRASMVKLTKLGEEVTVKIKACWKKLEDDFFSVLNEEEKTQLQKLLSKLNR